MMLAAADLQRRGQLAEALRVFEMLAGQGPADPRVLNGLGGCAFRLGQVQKAIDAYRLAIQLDPEVPILHDNLGHGLEQVNDFAQAQMSFERAIALAPLAPQPLLSLGTLFLRQNKADEAEACFSKAITLEPKSIAPINMMTVLLQQAGRFEEARTYMRMAMEVDPNQPTIVFKYVFGTQITAEDEWVVNRLKQIAVSLEPNSEMAQNIQFALGKAFEDLCRYDEAAVSYLEANRIGARLLSMRGFMFDSGAHIRDVDRIIASYPQSRISGTNVSEAKRELPVLIVGMMRSGTSLVEQVLASLPDIGGAGEVPFWLERGNELLSASKEESVKLGQEYVSVLRAVCPESVLVCDKLPQNYMILGPIHLAVPNARIIHCRRTPIENCLSIFTTPFSNPPPFAYNAESIALAYRQYLRVMEHWRQTLSPDQFIEVNYEDLVLNQEATTKRLIQFLGLDWSDSCLRPDKNPRLVRTPSFWQVRQPIYDRSIERSKRFQSGLHEEYRFWDF